jgi:Bacterial regulatory protein, Fis family
MRLRRCSPGDMPPPLTTSAAHSKRTRRDLRSRSLPNCAYLMCDAYPGSPDHRINTCEIGAETGIIRQQGRLRALRAAATAPGSARRHSRRQPSVSRACAACNNGTGARPAARSLAWPTEYRHASAHWESAPPWRGANIGNDAAWRVRCELRCRSRSGLSTWRCRAIPRFTIRNVDKRAPADLKTPRELPHSAAELAGLIGRSSLRELVRETTDVIERLCIEAALKLTGGNRATAAEMLGLSRQSLYAKLRRHGVGDGAPDGG